MKLNNSKFCIDCKFRILAKSVNIPIEFNFKGKWVCNHWEGVDNYYRECEDYSPSCCYYEKKIETRSIEQIDRDIHYKERERQLPTLLSQSLQVKCERAIATIKEYIETIKKDVYSVSYSGGKDSQVMLLLILKVLPPERIKLIIAYEMFYPNILENIKKTINKYKLKVEWTKPKMSFWDVIEKYGVFYSSKKLMRYINTYRNYLKAEDKSKYKGIETIKKFIFSSKVGKWFIDNNIMANDKCCSLIKNSKKNNADFVGLRVLEGLERRRGWLLNGCNNFGVRRCSHPVSLFTDKDIFDYLRINWYIPPCYSFLKRTGCMACPFGWKDKREYLKITYPNLYNKIMSSKLGDMYRGLGVE